MFSRVGEFCVKSCLLASFTSVASLVRLYISTINRSNSSIDSLLVSLGMHWSSLKAPFTSEKDFHVSQAVFFHLLANEDTVSQPVNA